MKLEKFSLGVGDRFAHQAKAQLAACVQAADAGIGVVPVWNKSNREHNIVHSEPSSVREAADAAVHDLNWTRQYCVDADHINLKTVDRFLAPSDFFTLDVAESIGRAVAQSDIDSFLQRHGELIGRVPIDGIPAPLDITKETATRAARQYLFAVKEAGEIYRYIESKRGRDQFITEVSMDETDAPQTPPELLLILAAIADEGIPIQTIAPKFTGRFNKGVDYVGDVVQFEREFNEDLAVIAYAVKEFGLPADLKLSVHSGSDKFSIYPAIRRAIRRTGAGLHIKTAGTTWLEELIGLASAGGDGLQIAKEVYSQALGRFDELCGPYATVIDIDKNKLPSADEVAKWDGERYARTLRHDQSSKDYNPHVRQLLHVGYKVAAQMESRYTDALKANEAVVAKNVTENLFDRHMKRVFIGE